MDLGEGFQRLRDELLDRLRQGDVSLDREGLAAARFYLLYSFESAGEIEVGDNHARPFLGKFQGGGSPDPRARAGYDRHAILKLH
jgi:hypothetical protein